MKRSDLITALLTKNKDLSISEVETFVDLFFLEIIESMERGENVTLRGFGNFGVRYRRARIARNPRTGENVPLNERKSGYFRCSNKLLKSMNGED